jgi:tRNA threonylcarbamoyladenosine biosynthesis protein TsaB
VSWWLALDTCGAESSVALCQVGEGGKVTAVGQKTLPPRTAASLLTPALDEVLREVGVRPSELDAVLVVDGPGSFTGIRLGLAAGKALVQACGMALLTVSRLRVLASTHGAAAAVLDAGRGEVFFGTYRSEPATEQVVSLAEAAGLCAGQTVVACEARLLVRLPGAVLVQPPTALDATRLVAPARGGFAVDAALVEGRYLRTELYGRPA